MAGAQAQHSLGNRETPRIAAGIFPIGGASGQRMRRYFFGASPPGEGGGTTRKSREQQEEAGTTGRGRNSRKEPGTMRVPQCQKCQTTPPTTRTGRRGQPAGQTTGGGQRAAHSRKQAAGDGQRAAPGSKQAAGGQQSAGQAAASRLKEDFMYIQTTTIGRRSSGTATAPGRGNQGTIRNRLRPVPAKNMQANRYYPQRYRESTGKGISGGR